MRTCLQTALEMSDLTVHRNNKKETAAMFLTMDENLEKKKKRPRTSVSPPSPQKAKKLQVVGEGIKKNNVTAVQSLSGLTFDDTPKVTVVSYADSAKKWGTKDSTGKKIVKVLILKENGGKRKYKRQIKKSNRVHELSSLNANVTAKLVMGEQIMQKMHESKVAGISPACILKHYS